VLAHDLGHTPFGHAGERVLADVMRDDGGFDHNRQSLRVVDLLEERYPDFRGLNLSYETREGILKHGCNWSHPVSIPKLLAQSSLEAQVADHADEIAYTVHDLDDGLRSGLLDREALKSVVLWDDTYRLVCERLGTTSDRVLFAQTIRLLIDRLVTALIEHSASRLKQIDVGSVDQVRQIPEGIIDFESETATDRFALKRFLYENLYEHPQVAAASARGAEVIRDLVAIYRGDTDLLPHHVQARFDLDGEFRAIADYVAGMTDPFALDECARLRGVEGS
jgi:dGTPase